MDEAHLNKKKSNMLNKYGRPQKDQVWVQGFVVQNHSEIFMFKVLEHPQDCHDGRPRGKQEILKNLNEVGPTKDTILVSDKWKGTVAAIKQYRLDHGFTESQLPHEVVNHSEGEIKNSRGFTTNLIESKWSVLKRWVRRVNGGRMPTHSDRDVWRRILTQFQFRKLIEANSVDASVVEFFRAVAETYH